MSLSQQIPRRRNHWELSSVRREAPLEKGSHLAEMLPVKEKVRRGQVKPCGCRFRGMAVAPVLWASKIVSEGNTCLLDVATCLWVTRRAVWLCVTWYQPLHGLSPQFSPGPSLHLWLHLLFDYFPFVRSLSGNLYASFNGYLCGKHKLAMIVAKGKTGMSCSRIKGHYLSKNGLISI